MWTFALSRVSSRAKLRMTLAEFAVIPPDGERRTKGAAHSQAVLIVKIVGVIPKFAANDTLDKANFHTTPVQDGSSVITHGSLWWASKCLTDMFAGV